MSSARVTPLGPGPGQRPRPSLPLILLAGLLACSEADPTGAPPTSDGPPTTATSPTLADGIQAVPPAGPAATPGSEAGPGQAADDHSAEPPADSAGSPVAPSPANEPAPADEPAPLPDLTGWLQTEGHQGLHTLAWRPLDHERVPRNQEFSAEVLLLRDGALAPGARLQVTGYMPAHAHGLVQMPVCEEVGQGRYRVDGLLLHMRGHWQVRFTIVADRQVETATFELDL